MAQETFGAKKFLIDKLTEEQVLDSGTLEECESLCKENNLTFSEVLVSEGIVTDQKLGRLLDKFAQEGHISPPELNLLKNEFPSNWERWKEMEGRDVAGGPGESEGLADVPECVVEAVPVDWGKAGQPPVSEGGEARPVRPAGVEKEPEAPEAQEERRIGGCTILEKLGEGRLGSVYKGVMEALGRSVAIRLIPVEMVDSSRRAGLLEEATATSKIEHRNVASVISAGQEPQYLYVVSNYVEGESLRSRLTKVKTLAQEKALEVALAVARGLSAGYDLDIFHGEIRPENIFFDHEGIVVITDFGLAGFAGALKQDTPGQPAVSGSPHYTAPEQPDMTHPDVRTDIYSLGVVLYEMLTGLRPFDGASPYEIKDAHLAGRYRPLTSEGDRVSPAMAEIVAKMMAREPRERYQEITQLINDLVELKQHLTFGGAPPAIAQPGTAAPQPGAPPGPAAQPPVLPELPAEVLARAAKYKTFDISPDIEERSKAKIAVIIIVVLLLAAGGALYALRDKIGITAPRETFEDKAARALRDVKTEVDISLSRGRFIDAFRQLGEFPPKYNTPRAGNELKALAARIVEEADRSFESTHERVAELTKKERFEDAMRINRVLKSRVEQIVSTHSKRWEQVATLKRHLESAARQREKIARVLDELKNFEKDMKSARKLLKEQKPELARRKIEIYLNSVIKKHSEESEKLAKLIAACKDVLERQAEKEARWKKFKEVAQAARHDKDEESFDEALKRIERFFLKGEAQTGTEQWNFDDALRRTVAQVHKERQGTKMPLELLLDAEVLLSEIERACEEYMARKAEYARAERFKADIEYARMLIQREAPDSGEKALAVVRSYENAPSLTPEQRQTLTALEEMASRHVRFAGDLKTTDKLLSSGKFTGARNKILPWLNDQDEIIARHAKAKYLQIMNTREPGMVYIPGGALVLGSDDEDDNNPKRNHLYGPFYIDRGEVTCEAYGKFVTDTGHPPPLNWPKGLMPRQWKDMPVTGVGWKDAAAYAKWAGKRLPTDAQWEIAASWDGSKKVFYPWGDKYVPKSANIATGSLEKAKSRPKDSSPNGVLDMAGNVAEWTATTGKESDEAYFVRGSSARAAATTDAARTTRRTVLPPGTMTSFLGFRCAKDPE